MGFLPPPPSYDQCIFNFKRITLLRPRVLLAISLLGFQTSKPVSFFAFRAPLLLPQLSLASATFFKRVDAFEAPPPLR